MQHLSQLLKGKNKTDKVKKASGTSVDPDEEVEHVSESHDLIHARVLRCMP